MYEYLYTVGVQYYIVWSCIGIGFGSYLIMFLMSLGPRRKSNWQILDEQWLREYNEDCGVSVI